MKKQISYKIVSLVFSVLVVCFAIAFYVVAWDEPIAPPPGGDIYAPLNTGPDPQIKVGGLILNTGGAANGLAVVLGKVGIGTTDPGTQTKLHVYEGNDTAWSGRGVFSGLTNAAVIGTYNGKAAIGGHNAALTAWSDLLINFGGGNVGIGTPSPGAKLDVQGAIASNRNWYYLASAGDMNHAIGNIAGDGEQFRYWNFLDFYSPAGGGNIRFLANGNVGIGTTTPIGAKLDVVGDVGGVSIQATGDICTDVGGGACLSAAGGDGSIGVFGSWTDKDSANKTLVKDVVYKVSSDGFIEIITTSVDEPGEVWLYTGSTSNPETVSARNSSNQNYHYWTIHYPIPRDTYFKVVLPVVTATIKWLPIGVGDCVEQP